MTVVDTTRASFSSYEAFSRLRATTKCPFAPRAKVIFGPEWSDGLSFKENVNNHALALRSLAERIVPERLDGFVSFVRTKELNPSFSEVRAGFGQYLFQLAETDRSCSESMSGDFLSRDWQFTHSDVRFFLNVFSDCYPQPHSKYSAVEGGFYVFFQPEISFTFCSGPPLKRFKNVIRERFFRAQMPYDGERIDRRIESLIYMFPIEPDGEEVRWWEAVDRAE